MLFEIAQCYKYLSYIWLFANTFQIGGLNIIED